MARDVFISYSTKDKALANRICAFLESKMNIPCWIAHRDIVPGADWPESIVNAITGAKVMVMLVTENANESAQMARELARADTQRLPVIALRATEKVEPAKTLAYFLSTSHWMDVFPPPLESHLGHLGHVIQHVLANEPPPQRPPPKQINRRGIVAAGGAAGVGVLGAGAWWYYAGRTPSLPASPALLGGTTALAPLSDPGKLSITVLPLKNLSHDTKQEYFSDGQTDAITTALVQVQGLTLVAPQSAFLLGKHNTDLHTIGEMLNVKYVIDGTVNWADQQVRVAAQLVHVATRQIAWAEAFNRKFTNVMVLQDEIAKLIAAGVQQALKLPGISQAQASMPSLSNEAGTAFLQGKAQLRQRARAEPGGPLTAAAELFESVIRQAPDYLPAQALLVQVYGFIAAYHALFSTDDAAKLKTFNDQWLSKSERAAAKAIVQAPDNTIALSAMGFVQHLRGHLTAADDNYRRAYNMDSSNADILHLYSLLLLGTGKVAEAEALRKKLQKMEPMVTVYIAFNIASAWVSGDSERAQKMLESTTLPIPPGHPFFVRLHALIYAARGKFREASQIVLKAAATYDPSVVRAASDLLLAAASGADYQAPYLGFFSILHIYSKTPERALEYSQANRKAGFLPATESTLFWHRSKEFVALRSMEGFRALMRDTNFVDLWHSRGMPDLCRDGRGEDFCRL